MPTYAARTLSIDAIPRTVAALSASPPRQHPSGDGVLAGQIMVGGTAANAVPIALVSGHEGGAPLATWSTTDASGHYSFSGLAPGAYAVVPFDRLGRFRSKVIHAVVGEVVLTLTLAPSPAGGTATTDGTTPAAVSVQVTATVDGGAGPITYAWARTAGSAFAIDNAAAQAPLLTLPAGTTAADVTETWQCAATRNGVTVTAPVEVRLVRYLNAPPATDYTVSSQTFDADLTDAKGKVWTASNGASVSGGALVLTSTAYIVTPDHADWHFGSGPFTVEQVVKFNSAVTDAGLISQWGPNYADDAWALYLTSGWLYLRFYDGAAYRDTGAAFSPTPGTEYELAADRDPNGMVRVYVNGAVLASATFPQAIQDSPSGLRIGAVQGFEASLPLVGSVLWSRVTKGKALHAGAYTPGTGGNQQPSTGLDVTPASVSVSGVRGDTLTAELTASGGEGTIAWSWASGGQFIQIVDAAANPVQLSCTTAASTQPATRSGWLRCTRGSESVDRYVEFYFAGTSGTPA